MAQYKHRVLANGNSLDFNLPKSWEELSQKQLKAVLIFLSAYEQTHALVKITLYFANMILVGEKYGLTHCRVATDKGYMSIYISPEDMSALTDAMSWVLSPGSVPILLEELDARPAINSKLQGVPFGIYLQLDNLYQGYLKSLNADAVLAMANIVYHSDNPITELKQYELYGIVQWYTQLKALLTAEFSNFFRPAGEGNSSSVREAMNAQIRALTGGDVTKEELILSIDAWRALTELDAKAREAEEFKKTMKR